MGRTHSVLVPLTPPSTASLAARTQTYLAGPCRARRLGCGVSLPGIRTQNFHDHPSLISATLVLPGSHVNRALPGRNGDRPAVSQLRDHWFLDLCLCVERTMGDLDRENGDDHLNEVVFNAGLGVSF